MRTGLFISLALHGAILAWAVASIGSLKPIEAPKTERVEVEIMTVSDLTRLKAGAPKPKPEPAKFKPKTKPETKVAPKKAEKVAALPPKATEPKPVPEVKKADDAVKLKPKPKKLKVKPRKKKKTKAKKKKKKVARKKKKTPPAKSSKKQKFDTDRIAALLNRIPDAKAARGAPPENKQTRKKKKATIERGQANGVGRRLTISEFDFFMRQIGQCWNPPVGAAQARDLIPVIQFDLKPNGTLDGVPSVANWRASPFFQAAADAAIRAVIACQPYNLPKDKHKDWAENEITFDPKAMFGG